MNSSFDENVGDDWDDAPSAASPLIPIEAEDDFGEPEMDHVSELFSKPSPTGNNDEGWGDSPETNSVPVAPIGEEQTPIILSSNGQHNVGQKFVEVPQVFKNNLGGFEETSTEPVTEVTGDQGWEDEAWDDEGWGDAPSVGGSSAVEATRLSEQYVESWDETENGDEGWEDAPVAETSGGSVAPTVVPGVSPTVSPVVINYPTVGDIIAASGGPAFQYEDMSEGVQRETGFEFKGPEELRDVVKPLAPMNPKYLSVEEREVLAARQAFDLQQLDDILLAERAAMEAAAQAQALADAEEAARLLAEENGEPYGETNTTEHPESETNVTFPAVNIVFPVPSYPENVGNVETNNGEWEDAPSVGDSNQLSEQYVESWNETENNDSEGEGWDVVGSPVVGSPAVGSPAVGSPAVAIVEPVELVGELETGNVNDVYEDEDEDEEGWGDAPSAGAGNVFGSDSALVGVPAGRPLFPVPSPEDSATTRFEDSLPVEDIDDEEEFNDEGWEVLQETSPNVPVIPEQAHVAVAVPEVPHVAPEASVTPPVVPLPLPTWEVDPASVIRGDDSENDDEGWGDAPVAGNDLGGNLPQVFDIPVTSSPVSLNIPVNPPRPSLFDAPELKQVTPGVPPVNVPATLPASQIQEPTPVQPIEEQFVEEPSLQVSEVPEKPTISSGMVDGWDDAPVAGETLEEGEEFDDEGWGDVHLPTVPTVQPVVPTVVESYPTVVTPVPSVIPPVPTVIPPVPSVIPPVPTVVPVTPNVEYVPILTGNEDNVFTDKGLGVAAGSDVFAADVRDDSMPTHKTVVPKEPTLKLGSKIVLPESKLGEDGKPLVNPKSSKGSPSTSVAKTSRQVKRKSTSIGGIRLTGRDMRIMEFLARYRTATVGQLARRFETSETALRNRLPLLDRAGLIRWAWAAQTKPKVWMITAQGLKTVDMSLSAPDINWGQLRHTLGLVDLGIWYELQGENVLTEREIRAAAAQNTPTERLKNAIEATRYRADLDTLPVDGLDSIAMMERIKQALVIPVPGRPSGHWPDMILSRRPYPSGLSGNIAIELELTRKNLEEWRKILTAFLKSPDFDKVVYHVRTRDIQRSIQTVVKAIHGEDKIQVSIFEPIDQTANPTVNGGGARLN